MSHELKTPLNAIIGFGELLEDGDAGEPLTPKQREFVGHMVASGKHLVTLMNDILDLSRIEAGRIDLRRETLAIGGILGDALETVRPFAQKRGVILASNIAEDLPALSIDRVRFTQVLFNLLSNGIKFTPAGGTIRLNATLAGPGLEIAVEDTGIGISPIEPSQGPRQEGTGLGLALVKRLMELHGGSVRVDSEVARGSVFTVTFPLDGVTPAQGNKT
jgi:signal transduction histidine kinase